MKYRVQMTEKALADIEIVLLWLKEQGTTSACQRWFSALWKKLDTLESRPERCSLANEAEDISGEIRELYFGKRQGVYRILFEVRDQTVYILRIWHSSRDTFTVDDL